jgi:hypothetical protein
MELIFEVRDAEEGGYTARALGYSIFTQADDWDELTVNAVEAVSLFSNRNLFNPSSFSFTTSAMN